MKVKNDSLNNYIVSLLVILILIPALIGKERILGVLLLGYDNVGHLNIMKSISACNNFLSDCELTGSISPEGYRYYPQYFHFVFEPFLSILGPDYILHLYYFISILVFILFCDQILRYIDTNFHREFKKNYFNLRLDLRKSNTHTKHKDNTDFFVISFTKMLAILNAIYLLTLGYINFVFAILILFLWLNYHPKLGITRGIFFTLTCFVTSSSVYPLLLLPNYVFFTLVIFMNRKQFNPWIHFAIQLIMSAYTINLFKGNFATNFEYLATAGSQFTSIILIILISTFILIKSFLTRRTIQLEMLLLCVYTSFTSSLVIYMLITGNSSSYYAFKLSLLLICFVIPNLIIDFKNSKFILKLVKSLRNGFIFEYFSKKLFLKFFISVGIIAIMIPKIFTTAVLSLALNLPDNFKNPVRAMASILTDDKKLQSSRIIWISNTTKSFKKPIYVLSPTGAFDTIWVNTLNSTWNENLEEDLQSGILQNLNKPEKFKQYLKEGAVIYSGMCLYSYNKKICN